MASSNSSLNLSFSTRVLLLLLFLGCFRPSSSAALPTHTNDRWRRPCARDSSVTVVDDTGEVIDNFAGLSRMSIGLKQMVNSLKNDYVNARFGDESQAEEERVNSGLVITGSPSWTASSDNMTETLLVCYENLARLAVITRLTREAEETAPGNRDFATRFQRIEDHTESGLYVLMCNLHTVMSSMGIETMSPEAEAEVASITFDEGLSNAIRHVRDYIVILVQEDSVDKLGSTFDRLARQLASQTTPSTAQ